MGYNAPDYENNLAFDPDINTMPRCDIEALKSEIKHLKDLQNAQDKRVEELEKTELELEKVEKQLKIAIEGLKILECNEQCICCSDSTCFSNREAKRRLEQIRELDK